MHLAAKSPKVTFKYSRKVASLPKVKSSVGVSKKGIVGRRQEKKEKILIDYLCSKAAFFLREFMLRKLNKI